MSLWCGACREEIFDAFGILYELERTPEGNVQVPSEARPSPNSAVCAKCWAKIPEAERISDHRGVDRGSERVLAYAPADSENSPIWGSKEWSSIVADYERMLFIRRALVVEQLPRALEIIDAMAGRRRLKPTKPIVEVYVSPGFLEALEKERGTHDS